jgi:3-isopropylmalate/(R)-2-methylmalate dehydratase small subunit
VVIAESFARIFRQNMFNCGMLAIELTREEIDLIFALVNDVTISVDLDKKRLTVWGKEEIYFDFTLNSFDRDLVIAGGWLAYADKNY